MGSRIQCFMIEPSGVYEESLRRYVSLAKAKCPESYGYHNAEESLGEITVVEKPGPAAEGGVRRQTNGYGADDHPHDDPRWPKVCPCGYAFTAEDEWQHNVEQKWRRADTGEMYLLAKAPPGAMWYAPWLERAGMKGPDGRCLIVMTPAGDWAIDGPSKNGNGWTRTGTPPFVTANPSIGIGSGPNGGFRYHGFLTAGFLVEV